MFWLALLCVLVSVYIYLRVRKRRLQKNIDLFVEELHIYVASCSASSQGSNDVLERIMSVLNTNPVVSRFHRQMYRELGVSLTNFQTALMKIDGERHAILIYTAFLYNNLIRRECEKL
jgi:hypothetical protein